MEIILSNARIVNAKRKFLSPPKSTIKLPSIAPHNICIAPNKPLAEPTRFLSTDESAKTRTFANISPLPNPNKKQADARVKGNLINGTSDKNIKAIDEKHQ